jgi:DNA-binding response OmpR family regulator
MNIVVIDFLKRTPDQYDFCLKQNFKVNFISTSYEIERFLYELPEDLILIHSMNNNERGLELFKTVKAKYPWVPVIFMNDSATEEEIVEALSLGVDDYIVKQVSPAQLVARLNNKIKKKAVKEIKFDGGMLNFSSNTFEYQGNAFELTDIEFKILVLLINNPNKIVSKESVYNFLWRSDSVNLENLNSHVYNIRKKIHPFSECIKTVRKSGYMIDFNGVKEERLEYRMSS